MIHELGRWDDSGPKSPGELQWTNWRPLTPDASNLPRRAGQVLDFETAHALFMCLFCFLLTAEEYRDSINGFNLDQSIAIRIGRMIGDPGLAEFAYNKHPLYTFISDVKPGIISGEGSKQFPPAWWLVSPAGNAITKKT